MGRGGYGGNSALICVADNGSRVLTPSYEWSQAFPLHPQKEDVGEGRGIKRPNNHLLSERFLNYNNLQTTKSSPQPKSSSVSFIISLL